MTGPTSPASGALPADMRESLKWCAAALQAIGKCWAEHESSRFELVDTKASKSLSEILDDADAALACQQASPAPLTDLIDDFERDYFGFHLDHSQIQEWIGKLRKAALASPQVAPAPANEWNDAIEAAAQRIENGSFLHDQAPAKLFANQVVPVLRSMKRAAPAPVAPTSQPSEDGYATSFYEIASVLGIGARADTPENVFRNEMLPKIKLMAEAFGDKYCAECRRTKGADPAATETTPCEDCGGCGEVGEAVYQGAFQPPERDRCESCQGSGQWEVAPTQAQGPSEDARDAAKWRKVAEYAEKHRVNLLHLYQEIESSLPPEPEGEATPPALKEQQS